MLAVGAGEQKDKLHVCLDVQIMDNMDPEQVHIASAAGASRTP